MQSAFAWAYLLLCWNLMARSDNIQMLLFEHIWWENDGMSVQFIKTKTDSNGSKTDPKKVYANPHKPHICPVLALGVYVFTTGARENCSKANVWGNSGASSRFSKWLKVLLVAGAEMLSAMCIIIDDIGTHSFRKGIATYLSGMVGGPSPVNIYLRAGWSLGNQKRYILAGGGGDELCGRAATGLNINLEEFACLPPHFNLDDGPILSAEEWEGVFPNYHSAPATFKQVLPFLLASVLYHREWLNENLPASHPLRSSRVWTHPKAQEIQVKVHAGHWHNKTTGLSATGIQRTCMTCSTIDRLNLIIQTHQVCHPKS